MNNPFRYHLELEPSQLKILHTALSAMLDEYGDGDSDVRQVIEEILEMLPDERAMQAIQLDRELADELASHSDPPEAEPGDARKPISGAHLQAVPDAPPGGDEPEPEPDPSPRPKPTAVSDDDGEPDDDEDGGDDDGPGGSGPSAA